MSAQDLAQQLAIARGKQTQIDVGPYAAITTLDDAYAMQALATKAYSSPRIGYKVGATNEGVQKLFACDAPFYGPMFEAERFAPGHQFEPVPGLLGGEAEFAFRIGSDFPTDQDLGTDDLPDLIASVNIAVELVGRRTLGEGLPPLHAAIADFGANVAFIEGPSLADWRSINLAEVAVSAKTNGEETNNGTGAAVLGHPLNSLLWMHNSLRAIGSGLKAGEWVSTGTCLGVIKAVPGSKVDISFSGCGDISYTIT